MADELVIKPFEDFIEPVKKVFSEKDLLMIKEAYNYAFKHHDGQFRASGEPYFIHPIQVAEILIDLQMDPETLCSALMHDLIEDTEITYDNLFEKFGKNISMLVDGVSKLGKLSFKSNSERNAENLRKMLLAMIKDIRVMIIKLADRVNNMRTLKHLPVEKQKRNAQETLDIYAPLANRLGIQKIKWELEDLALHYIAPEQYQELKKNVEFKRKEREEFIEKAIEKLSNQLKINKIKVEIIGRPKHFYSIYLKMARDNIEFSDIYDLIGIRVFTKNISDCYAVLGICHKVWIPVHNRFKDFIAVPKMNMYQSLHTTVMSNSGVPLEIQIRTREMNNIAEDGIASHWSYKENKPLNSALNVKLTWLKQIIDWHKEITDANEFIENIKLDLFQDEVFIFTPRGEVKVLPFGATPIDFAYTIHTEVGHRCNGAKVNGRIVPLTYNLKNGDIVEILTGKVENPNRSWLKIVRSSSSKSKIKNWFKRHERVITVRSGKKLFLDILDSLKGKFKNHYDILPASTFNLKDIVKSERFSAYCKQKYNNLEHFYYALGNNEDNHRNILRGMFPEIEKLKLQDIISGKTHKPKKSKRISTSGVIVEGIDDVLVKLSKCCTPIPGDSIIGFITRGKGISVHRKDCPNIKAIPEKERLIAVKWDDTVIDKKNYSAVLKITASDRPNLLLSITNLLASYKLNISRLSAFTKEKGHAVLMINLEISSIENLDNLIKAIGSIPNVDEVFRTSGN